MTLKEATREQVEFYIQQLHKEHQQARPDLFNDRNIKYLHTTLKYDIIVRSNGEEVGIIGYLGDEHTLHIRRIYVLPQHRNKAVATCAILDLIESLCGNIEYTELTANVYTTLEHKLYHGLGFTVDTIHKNGMIHMKRNY